MKNNKRIMLAIVIFTIFVLSFSFFAFKNNFFEVLADCEGSACVVEPGDRRACSGTDCVKMGIGGLRIALVDETGQLVNDTHYVDYWLVNPFAEAADEAVEVYNYGDKEGYTIYGAAKGYAYGDKDKEGYTIYSIRHKNDKTLCSYYYDASLHVRGTSLDKEETLKKDNNFLSDNCDFYKDSGQSSRYKYLYEIDENYRIDKLQAQFTSDPGQQSLTGEYADNTWGIFMEPANYRWIMYVMIQRANNGSGNAFRTILEDVSGGKIQPSDSKLQKYFFQYEPLLAIRNLQYENRGGLSGAAMFYGTPSELIKYNEEPSSTYFKSGILGYLVKNIGVEGFANLYCGPPESDLPGTPKRYTNYGNSCNIKNGTVISPSTSLSDFYETSNNKYPGRSIAYVRIKDVFNDCDSRLKAALTNDDKDGFENVKKDFANSYPSSDSILNFSFDALKFYGYTSDKLAEAKCSTEIPCNVRAETVYNNCKAGTCNKINDSRSQTTYEENIITALNPDYSGTYLKSEWNLANIKALVKAAPSRSLPHSCNPIRCNQADVDLINKLDHNSTEYKEYFEWLFDATGAHSLKSEIWQELGLSGPKCSYPTQDCPAKVTLGACQKTTSTPTITFDDNGDYNNQCVKHGVAYNTKEQDLSTYQTSKDNFLSNSVNSCNAYCNESVQFFLPGYPQDDSPIKAGTVFKWGTTPDKTLSEFGSMTVSRDCFYRDEDGVECDQSKYKADPGELEPATFKTHFTNLIQTEIYLKYTEPSSKDKISEKLKINNSSYRYFPHIGTNGFYETATFDISYPEDFQWYSDKSDGSLTTITENNGTHYYEIGYGLPTAFTTPNGNYGDTMYVIIDKIGTYQNGKAHFDKLIKNVDDVENDASLTITHLDDVGVDADGRKFTGGTAIKYSCPFKITNELFGTECQYDSEGNLTDESPEYCDKNESNGKIEGEVQDIDVVFRTVELINDKDEVQLAFPGRMPRTDIDYRTGKPNSRNKGSNWASLDDSLIAGILSDDVYNDDPMYYIELDVEKINEIRDWNQKARNNGIDPYSEMNAYKGTMGFTPYEPDSSPNNQSPSKEPNLGGQGTFSGGNLRPTEGTAVENNNGNDGESSTVKESSTLPSGETGFFCYDSVKRKYCASRFLTALYEKNWISGNCINNNTSQRAKDYATAEDITCNER